MGKPARLLDASDIPALRQRRSEREQLVDAARRWAARLDPELEVRAVVVFGSVARGDFNVWSDLDVLVIADHLPLRWSERLALFGASRPPRLSPLGWTTAELQRQLARGNPIAVEARDHGVVVAGSAEAARLGGGP